MHIFIYTYNIHEIEFEYVKYAPAKSSKNGIVLCGRQLIRYSVIQAIHYNNIPYKVIITLMIN